MRPLVIDPRQLRSFDGTSIAYAVAHGERTREAPVVVLANGLGGTLALWERPIAYLGDRHRFVTWDLRPSPRAVSDHAKDLAAILAAERVERAAFVGWSFGVQVLLEALPLLHGVVESLALVNGVPGRPLDGVRSLAGLGVPVRGALALLERLPGTGRLGERAARRWLDRLGVIGRAADAEGRAALAVGVGRLSVRALASNLRAFAEHDAEATLSCIDVPVLVVAGDRDPLVLRERAQQMARRIPNAELLMVRGGAHAAPIEFPELVALRLERFWTR